MDETGVCRDGWSSVDRRLVHRRANAEVFVTRLRPADGHTLVDAQWPRTHSLFVRSNDYHISLLVESFRQAVMLAAHVREGVPEESAFLMRSVAVTVTEPAMLPVGSEPAEVTLRVCHARDQEWVAEFVRHGRVFASGEGSARIVPKRAYERLRQHVAAPSISSAPRMPRTQHRCIEAFEDHYLLAVDTADPVLFDHPTDHIPGMVLLEAATQVSRTMGIHSPLAIEGDFRTFVELGVPCRISAISDEATAVVKFVQNRTVCSIVRVHAGSSTSPNVSQPVPSPVDDGVARG